MPTLKTILAAAGFSAALFGAAGARAGGPNAPLCFALQNNFNQCMLQQQRLNARNAYANRWDDWEGWDDPYAYERRRWRHQRAVNKQAECARWLYAIQQNNCVQ